MKDYSELTKMFACKKDALSIKTNNQSKLDLSTRSVERFMDTELEKAIDYSEDVVVQRLRRMLP